jgi:hypothetical protein
MSTDTFRKVYTEVSQANKDQIAIVKDFAQQLESSFACIPASREMSIARTKLEESVMWAVKALTASGNQLLS